MLRSTVGLPPTYVPLVLPACALRSGDTSCALGGAPPGPPAGLLARLGSALGQWGRLVWLPLSLGVMSDEVRAGALLPC